MFKPGQKIWIKSIGAHGTVLKPKGQRFIVQVGNYEVECAASDLQLERPKGAKRLKYKISPSHHPALKPVKNPRALQSLDLHGRTVEEAIRLVEKRVSDAIIADLDKLEIVHGVGTGALLKAVHQYLAGLSVVAEFKLDPLNPGVTFVYFG